MGVVFVTEISEIAISNYLKLVFWIAIRSLQPNYSACPACTCDAWSNSVRGRRRSADVVRRRLEHRERQQGQHGSRLPVTAARDEIPRDELGDVGPSRHHKCPPLGDQAVFGPI